jgi:hypothetical protein
MLLALVVWAFVLGPAFCAGGLLSHLCDKSLACMPPAPSSTSAHSDRDGDDGPHGCHDDLCTLNITSPQPLMGGQLRLQLAAPSMDLPDPSYVPTTGGHQLAILHATADCLPGGPPSLAGRITPLLI